MLLLYLQLNSNVRLLFSIKSIFAPVVQFCSVHGTASRNICNHFFKVSFLFISSLLLYEFELNLHDIPITLFFSFIKI